MRKVIRKNLVIGLSLTLLFSVLNGCGNKKKGVLSQMIPLALMGTSKTADPVINKTYPTDEVITLAVGQQIILSPSLGLQGSTYTISPQLPAGLNFDSTTGILSGAPTEQFPLTVFTITQTKPDGTTVSWKVTIGVNGSNASSNAVVSPTFSLPSGHYSTAQSVIIRTSLPGGTVRCTTDGSDPTISSEEFSGPVHIWSISGAELKCRVFQNDNAVGEIASALYSYPPLKTNQTNCRSFLSLNGNSLDCAGTGQDGELQKGAERTFTDNGDETVSDFSTGLVWQKCVLGQNSDDNCSGSASLSSWADAENFCSNFTLGGKTWRLPTRADLATLADYSIDNPVINSTFFPNLQTGTLWSSTSDVANIWGLDTGWGNFRSYAKTSSQMVKCVSGRTKTLNQNFSFMNGMVKDNSTGLTWQKCSAGQNNDADCTGSALNYTWTNASSFCNGLSLNSNTWRLPNINELRSIIDYTKPDLPRINLNVFPNTSSVGFWSSTYTLYGSSELAISMNAIENSSVPPQTASFNVRCVSGP